MSPEIRVVKVYNCLLNKGTAPNTVHHTPIFAVFMDTFFLDVENSEIRFIFLERGVSSK